MIALGALLSVLFVPGIPAPANAPRWALLSLAIPLLYVFKDIRWGASNLLFIALLGYAALLPMPNAFEGVNSLWILTLGAALACAMNEGDFRKVMIGMGCGAVLNAAVTAAQTLGWEGLPQTYIPGGLFMNKNPNGEIAALVLIAMIGYRKWWLVPAPLLTLVLSGSKASMIGVAAAAVFVTRTWLLAGAALVLLTATAIPLFEGHLLHAFERVEVWRLAAQHLTLLGNGLGSFQNAGYILTGTTYTYAHNDWLQLVYEFGIGVVPLVGLVILAVNTQGCRVEKAVLTAFAVEGCFGFPFYLPATFVVACVGLGGILGVRRDLLARIRASQSLLRHGYAGARRHFGSPACGAGGADFPIRSRDETGGHGLRQV